MHKDPYENIYVVLSGYKDFILIPPTDAAWIPYRNYPLATYKFSEDTTDKDATSSSHSQHICKCGYRKSSKQETTGDLKDTETNQSNCTLAETQDTCPHFTIVPDSEGSQVPWVSIDPLNPDLHTFPAYANARPLRVRVEAGDMLYLPSLWFHHVSQSHACVAVNYWYDMNFDVKYSYYQAVQALTWTSR